MSGALDSLLGAGNNTSVSDPVSRLIFELSKLPGVGEKTATRLAYFILKQDISFANKLANTIRDAKEKVHLCSECFNFTEQERCRICESVERERDIWCIVEKPSDVFSVEQSGVHRGLYHVLHGMLSPLDGVGPEDLKIRELLQRINYAEIKPKELIIATNPSIEGEATALYLARLLKPLSQSFGLKISQLAHGLPVGGLLEYTDRQTIGRAMTNRMEIRG